MFLKFLTLIPLLPTALSSPIVSGRDTPDPSPPTETWTITNFNLHFMTPNTGFTWDYPDNYEFQNSTLHFEIILPTGNATCDASWPITRAQLKKGTLPHPSQTINCRLSDADSRQGENVQIILRPLPEAEEQETTRLEMAFELLIGRRVEYVDGVSRFLNITIAHIPIRHPADIMCTNGRPYDGMRCTMTSAGPHTVVPKQGQVKLGKEEVPQQGDMDEDMEITEMIDMMGQLGMVSGKGCVRIVWHCFQHGRFCVPVGCGDKTFPS